MGKNPGNCSSAMISSALALKVLIVTATVCGVIAFPSTDTSPVTEFKEETDRILAERVETGHWQTLSTADAGVTEKWIPATPATDMLVTEDATEDEAQDWETASVNASDDTYQWVPDTD